jgi:hypothetical protein
MFELQFEVDKLQASLFKHNPGGDEKPLGSVTLRQFGLNLVRAEYDMEVDVRLKYVISVRTIAGSIRISPVQFFGC